MVVGFEAVHCRADDSMQVVHRGRLETLRPTPIECLIRSMVGLRIERQYLLVQPLTEQPEIGPGGRPKPEKAADRLPMPASLATVEFVSGQHSDWSPHLRPYPLRCVRIDPLMPLGKPSRESA